MTQKERIREFLDSGRSLVRIYAWDELGIVEAPARISELRREGYPVITTMTTVINRYGEKVRVARWSKNDTAGPWYEEYKLKNSSDE